MEYSLTVAEKLYDVREQIDSLNREAEDLAAQLSTSLGGVETTPKSHCPGCGRAFPYHPGLKKAVA